MNFQAGCRKGQNGYWNEVYEGKKLKPNTAYDLFMSEKCDGANQVGQRKLIMKYL